MRSSAIWAFSPSGVDLHDAAAVLVLDVDLRAGLLGDLADDLALRPDHLADLVAGDVLGEDARRVGFISARGSAMPRP
jgi:hypothetical protein